MPGGTRMGENSEESGIFGRILRFVVVVRRCGLLSLIETAPSPFHQGGSGGILPVLFLGAVKVMSFFYAQPAGRISEVLIGIFKGNPMLPFDVG